MVDIVAVQPAHVGECTVGNFRLGVYTSKWELAMRSCAGYQSFTHRVAKYPSVHSATGIAYAQYTVESILGILVEKGGSLPSFAAGVLMKMDAVFLHLDPSSKMNCIYYATSGREYEVKEIERRDDPLVGGLAFYASHLELKELNSLGGL